MKPLKHIGLALMYLLISLGITTSIHYCGNKITKINILYATHVNCACDAVGKMNCCHDAQFSVKLELPSTLLERVIVDKIAFINLFLVSTSTLYNPSNWVEEYLVEYINDHPPQQTKLIETIMLRI